MPSPIPSNTPAAILPHPIATPTHGAPTPGAFTIATSSHIAAPPLQCLLLVLDTTTYPKWNTFTPKSTITSQPSTPSPPPLPNTDTHLRLSTLFTLTVHLDPSSPSSSREQNMQVTRLEEIAEPGRKGWRVAWKLMPTVMMPEWMLRTERVQEFVETQQDGGAGGGTETEYVCWETFYGVLAGVTRLAVGGKVVGGFEAWGRDLAREVVGGTVR